MVIAFLSDFGLDDEFVGVCKGVIAGIAPAAIVVDLTHAVPPGDVRRGAVALVAAVPFLPDGSVVLAVVDPGVGTDRGAIAARTARLVLVGPDNGLLSPAWERDGGVSEAVALEVPGSASPTFHGRDVFAPAAARLAAGGGLADLGERVDPASLVRLPMPWPEVSPGRIEAEVVAVDRFGNVQLWAASADLESSGLAGAETLGVEAGSRALIARRARTFSELPPEGDGLIVDSAGLLAIVRNGGSAAEALEASSGTRVVLTAPVG